MSERALLSLAGADGNAIAAMAVGPRDGWPVVLAHGGGQTRHAWAATARHMGDAGFRAIAVDQRGHGDSAWPDNKAYAFSDFGRDMIAVAEAARHETNRPPALVGASLGGIAGMLALAEAGDSLFSALVLVDITPWMDPSGVDRITGFMRARSRDGFATLEEAAEAIAAYLPNRERPKSLEGLRKNLRLHDDGRYRWHWDPDFLDGDRPVHSDYSGAQDAMLTGLARSRLPILLVRGRNSELIGEDHAAEFLNLVPHAEYTDISGAGHMVAGDRNDLFGAAVIEFLDRLRGGARR